MAESETWEKAEWLNTIIKRFWPYLNQYVRSTLFQAVEPKVDEILKEYKLNPFKFERDQVFLGQKPPKISGIKVYDDLGVNKNKIILDVDIVYDSDLEIAFKIKKFATKMSDFGLRGKARIILELIGDIPLISGFEVYFLDPPEIDYDLGGVASVLETPVLSMFVQKIMDELIKNFLVHPNKVSISLVDMNSIPNKVVKCPDSAGVLRVKMIRAKNLINLDRTGKSDPYVILTLGGHTFTLPTVPNTSSPVWQKDNLFEFPVEDVEGQELLLEFYDDDNKWNDEFMGRVKIQTSSVAEKGNIESGWFHLMDGERRQGEVQVSLSWLEVNKDYEVVKAIGRSEKDGCARGLVYLYIDSCSGLVSLGDPGYHPKPVVRIINPGERPQQSGPNNISQDPIIEQGFVSIIKHPYTDEIRIDVIDTLGRSEEVLGTCSINVWRDLVEQEGMEQPLRLWMMEGDCPHAKILMSASFRGLLPAGTVQSGSLKLTVHQARYLERKDLDGKSDPYVVINYKGERVGQTRVLLNPVWEEEFFLDITEKSNEMIEVRVLDKDEFTEDDRLGDLDIDVRLICEEGKLSKAGRIFSS